MRLLTPLMRRLRGPGLGAELLRGGLAVGATMVAGLAAGLVSAILLARALGPADLGVYAMAMAILALVSLPIESGLPALVTREIARARALGDAATIARLARFADMAALGLGALILGGLYAGLAIWGRGGALAAALMPAVVVVPLVVLGNLRGAAVIGLGRSAAGTLPTEVVRPLGLALAVALYPLVTAAPLTPAGAVMLQIPGALAAWGLAAWTWARARPQAPGGAPRPGETAAWTRATFRLGLGRGLRVGDGHLMTLMVGALATPAAAGFLRVALRGAEVSALGHRTIVQLLGPQIARLDALGDRARLQTLLTRSAQAMTLVQAGALALFALAGGPLIEALFGPEFRPALTALIVLTAVHLVRAIFGATPILLISLRREGAYLLSLGLKIALGLALGGALIRGFGQDGAALALLIGTTVQSIYLWRVSRSLGLRPTALGL